MDFKYELHHLKGNSYYIDGPTNIGLYKLNEKDIVLIDSGTNEDVKMIYKVILENHFNLKYIIDTHSHADHSGGNLFLMKMTDAKVIASKIERAFLRDSKLDIGFLYGGYPLDEFDNKLMHIDENKEIYSLDMIPKNLKSFKLPGHHYAMIGIKTDDDVYYVADTLGSKELIDSQHILLIYNVEGYLDSLNYIESLNGNIIVPSHSVVTTNISSIVDFNRKQIYEIIDIILLYLKDEHTIEEVTSHIFEKYNLKISYNKYMLITSTIRSYLAYLSNKKKIVNYFKDNKLYFKNNN